MYATCTFSKERFLQDEPREFSIRIVPEEMEGREVESFICFSRQPSLLEIKKGEDVWLPCSGIFGCSLLVDEEICLRAAFSETGKVKMDWYCTKEGSILKEVVQYADVCDPSLPDIECSLPAAFDVHEEVEFSVRFLTPSPSDRARKVQYMFSSMDSVKRLERLVEDSTSSWNGRWLLIDRSQFSTGEMFQFTGDDTVKFKTSFLAWGSFKLHVLVDGVLQATFPFKVKSRLGARPDPKEPAVYLEKAPKGCQMTVETDRIYISYPEKTTQNWWKTQAKTCSGPASPNECYCTLRFVSPKPAEWCRTVVESISGTWTTEFRPVPASEENSCLWSFPVARKVNGTWKELDWCRTGTFYKVAVSFCNLERGVWKEASSKTWTVKCRHLAESPAAGVVWSSELLYYLRMILNGCTTASAVKAFGTWHKWPHDRIYSELMKTQENFGQFAMNNGLVRNAEEMSAVNWLIARDNPMAQDRLGLYGFNPDGREARSLESALVRSGWHRRHGIVCECGCRK